MTEEPLQTEEDMQRTLVQIDAMRELIEAEDGPFTVEPLPTNRILMTTEKSGKLVAYLSEPGIGGRLVIDDYVWEHE